VIMPLYKGKGSRMECGNHRAISLLSSVGKLYDRIERVQMKTKDKIWDVQGAFMSGRGCMDQIFSLRVLTEKFLAKNQKLFCAFVDLQKAYDRVDRKMLWKVLSKYGVSTYLIQAIASLYEGSVACVRVNGVFTGWIDITKGVKQGCVMSP